VLVCCIAISIALEVSWLTSTQLDLHSHSPLVPADYRGPQETTARQIVESALEAGLGLLAVTDHFSVDFVPHIEAAARRHAAESGVELLVVPGAEIRVAWGEDEVHLIALFPPESYRECFDELARTFGIDHTALLVEDLPRVTLRAHPSVVARRIVELGGLCHIAHADRVFGSYRLLDRPLFDRLAGSGAVAAVELVDPANRGEAARRAPGVSIIASSDAHSPSEIGRRRTTLLLDEPSFAGLARALGVVDEESALAV